MKSIDTAIPDLRRTLPTQAHEHAWCVESRHRISTGEVLYVRCADCGTRRVDLREPGVMPPVALSALVEER